MMRLILGVMAFEGVLLALLLGVAGRWNLPWVWGMCGLHGVGMLGYMHAMGPELMRERFRPAGVEHHRWLRLALIPQLLMHLVTVGLDLRFNWSGEVSPLVRAAGLGLMALALMLAVWCIRTNRFFSSVVRIQSDRGHHVITTGPYRYVRHPGYLGMFAAAVGGAIALGSWWSLLPLLPVALVLARRAYCEEQLLLRSLEGYADYAQSVRYRLLPGVW